MLLSKNLRTALGTASLLMSLVVADSSFAAAAPKAVAKKVQPTSTSTPTPTYGFSVNGSGSFAMRQTSTGLTLANVAGYPNSNLDDIIDMGTYGQGFFLAMTAQGQYGSLSYSTDIAFSPIEVTSEDNIALSFRDVGVKLAGNPVNAGNTAASTEAVIANYLGFSLQSANVTVGHESAGSLTMGLGSTMSGIASDVHYSKQGSELGHDFATVAYTQDNGTARSSIIPLFMLSMPKGQGKAYRVEYKAPAMISGLDMGVAYAPADFYANTQSVVSGSLGLGATYETHMDATKVKIGVSAANNIGLNSAFLPSEATFAGQDARHELAETAWVRRGTTYGVSAAVAAYGFDASVAYQSWNPYNDRRDANGDLVANYKKADGMVVRAGYSANLTSMGATHVGVRYGNVKNAFQTTGATTNSSKAVAMDVGLTQSIGNAELYAAYTKFDKPTAVAEHTNAGAVGANTTINLKEMSGFVAGMKYSW